MLYLERDLGHHDFDLIWIDACQLSIGVNEGGNCNYVGIQSWQQWQYCQSCAFVKNLNVGLDPEFCEERAVDYLTEALIYNFGSLQVFLGKHIKLKTSFGVLLRSGSLGIR